MPWIIEQRGKLVLALEADGVIESIDDGAARGTGDEGNN